MSKPVILLNAGNLVSLFGTDNGDVLTWDGTAEEWVSQAGGGGGGGVTSLTAGTGVTVSSSTGSVTVSIGQSVATSDSVTFAAVGLTDLDAISLSRNGLQRIQKTSNNGQEFAIYGDGGGGRLQLTGGFNASGSGGILGLVGGQGTTGGEAFLCGGVGSSGAGGNVNVNGGTGTTVNGALSLGTSSTRSVEIGASAITTTINGTLSLGNALTAANGGTNNASLAVTQGTVYYGDGSKLVGLDPGTSGQFLQTQGVSANPQWASVTAQPYDLRGAFVGNPATAAVIDRFVADRAVTVSTTTTDHRFYCTTLPASGTVVLTVYKTPLAGTGKVAMFTATYTSGGSATGNSLYAATIGTVSNNTLVAGDLVTVEVGTTQAAFATPVWTIAGTV